MRSFRSRSSSDAPGRASPAVGVGSLTTSPARKRCVRESFRSDRAVAGTTDSSKRMVRLWLRSWNSRASASGAISRLELPILRKYPPGLLCTNRLRATSTRNTGTNRPSSFSNSTLRMSASSAGVTESLQISRTQPSRTSSVSGEMSWIRRVWSWTPRTIVPPRLLASAANSSATSPRAGARTLLPDTRTLFSSRLESSPSRMRRLKSASLISCSVRRGRLSADSRRQVRCRLTHGYPSLVRHPMIERKRPVSSDAVCPSSAVPAYHR